MGFFSDDVKCLVNKDWKETKFLNDNQDINPQLANIPNNSGGITNSKTVELLILYCVDKSLLKENEKERLVKDLQALLVLSDQRSVLNHLKEFELKKIVGKAR